MQHIFLKVTVTVLLLLLVTSLAWGADNQMPASPSGIIYTPSVPNLINFQGRLTDASGNPVANGSHTVNFTLWTLPSGGANVWTENTSQTTSGGLFTHNLGSITTLNPGLLEGYDSLYLQIVADGQTISPRIRLTSTSFSHVSGALEVRGFNPSVLAVNNFGHGLQTYGDDALQQIRLWGEAWGEIFLHDYDVSNDLTVVLTASADQFGTGGGALWLGNDAGSTTISLQGGTTGDASAVFPNSAINALEMLNEPGVSNSAGSINYSFGSGNITYVVDSVDITIPASGYVEVTCGGAVLLSHINGATTQVFVNSGKTRGTMETGPGFQFVAFTSPFPTGLAGFPTTSTRLYVETAGTKRYYLHCEYTDGASATTQIQRYFILAKYYPTLMGTSTIASDGHAPLTGLTETSLEQIQALPQSQVITVEEHNARLESELSQLKAEMDARLQKLEQQVNKTTQAGIER